MEGQDSEDGARKLDQEFVWLNSVSDSHGFNMDPDLALCIWI
jgi:hypothetical protein